MNNLDKLQALLAPLTLGEREMYRAQFIGALSVTASSEAWERALKTIFTRESDAAEHHQDVSAVVVATGTGAVAHRFTKNGSRLYSTPLGNVTIPESEGGQ